MRGKDWKEWEKSKGREDGKGRENRSEDRRV